MRKTLLLLLTVAALIAAMALGSASASADGYYCGLVSPPYGTCGDGNINDYYADGNFSQNIAWYPGSGNVGVCEHVYTAGWGSTLSRRCATNYVGAGSDLCQAFYRQINYSMFAYVGNNSGAWHTIDGWYSTSYGGFC